MLRAYHTCWSAPSRARERLALAPPLADYELLTALLSALQWRAHSGTIALYADDLVAEFLDDAGLLEIWDGGVDTATLDATAGDLDAPLFWSAGKLLALAAETAPIVMVDLDFIAWHALPQLQEPHDLVVIHRETLDNQVYAPPEKLSTAAGYEYDPEWSWEALPCNAAFVSFGEDGFREYFSSEALRFARGNHGPEPVPSSLTVFAEQRLLGMCAQKRGIAVVELLPLGGDLDDQPHFTHLWGYKGRLAAHPGEADSFCRDCADRLTRDHPDWAARLASSAALGRYFGPAAASR